MNAVTQTVAAEPVSGVEIFVPLAKLKKSPRNARKVPHGEAAIEALAASIQHKGLIQNLVIEPEAKEDGTPTGCYFVTAGEGRRLAMLLRAKRKQIRKSEPVRCWLDTRNDPSEVSLDENVTRTPMHPADQFERFAELSRDKGWGAEEIGARFGVTASVVKQRLRLGAVSPKLLQVYREDGLTLDQLMAFGISEDHARQEQVFENLHHNREPWIIRRDMTAANVPADDRRAMRNPTPGRPLAAVIPLDKDFLTRIASLLRFHRRLLGRAAGPLPRGWPLTAYRLARLDLMLRALDLRDAGATYREIAVALGRDEAAQLSASDWKMSSARSFVVRLVRDGIAMMNGDYRKLLRIR